MLACSIAVTGDTTLAVRIREMLRCRIDPEIHAIDTLMPLFTIIVASVGLHLRSTKS